MAKIQFNVADSIVKQNHRRELKNLGRYACRSIKGNRLEPDRERIPDRKNVRTTFFHDTDRVIHSRAYTRYIDKTQVFYLIENDHITHRVLHVQLVSKIARTIGRFLRLNEDLLEAIALGHDVGHAPYGHDGEEHLKNFCKKMRIGTFAHNAQSVRLLTEIENYGKGCNLTLQVLDGILCHNGEILQDEYRPIPNKSWKTFQSEYKSCMKTDEASKKLKPTTLEACVMRISDVISYIGRDVEDAITLKLIKKKDVPRTITNVLGSNNSRIVDTLVSDLVSNSYDKDYLNFSPYVFNSLQSLLSFNNQEIYNSPKKTAQDKKIEKMFNTMTEKYLDDLENHREDSLIFRWARDGFREDYNYMGATPNARIVVDYIAGMTDNFLNTEYSKMVIPTSFGHNFS